MQYTENDTSGIIVQTLPNPVRTQLQLQVRTDKASVADVYIIVNGRTLYKFKEGLVRGNNTLSYNQTQNMPSGTYYLRLNAGDIITKRKFIY